ncbi:hypothetical protein [Bordetella pertussis]|nr:hypothetical protein [Bordetella pertussis]
MREGGRCGGRPCWHRPHQGIGRAVPISRLNLDKYNLLTVHT